MVIKIDRISPKQIKFMEARKKHIGFGGARGGGKSWSVQTKSKLLALNYSGIKILIVRRTYPELINNHIRQMRKDLTGIAKYNDKEKIFNFPNGSSIQFTYCGNDADLDRLQGCEFDIIFLDEATQLTEYQMKTIEACLRGTNDFPKRIYYTCNPGGQGHAYIKRIFIDRKYIGGEDPDDYEFIQSLVTDNEVLMEQQPDYIKQLEALPAKLRKAWLEGSWDIFEGCVFEEFRDNPEHYEDRQWTHVIKAFEPPREWPIYRSYDFGYSKPFSMAWWTVDREGCVYRILEEYGCTDTPNEGIKWNPEEQFRRFKEIENTHPWLKGKSIHGVADPAIFNAESGDSVADVAAKHSIFFNKGDNQRIPGWMQMHYRMAFDDNGYPMMYIFENCKAFIRTIPLMMYDKHKVEDIDTNLEDHVADEARYFLMSRPIAPRTPETHKPIADDPLNMLTQQTEPRRFKYLR
jgi:hypothetical protein